jgi:RNA polymerase sigma-70 factor (ECF subfamily)
MKNDEFTEILRLYGDMAYRMACHLTRGDEPVARDLVQDAFVKIWKIWDWQRPDSFKGWMYRILHNLYMDYLRKKGREKNVSYDSPHADDDADFANAYPDTGPHVLDQLEQQEMQKCLHHALDNLSEDFRIPIVLCDMEGLSYEEIARIVSCPIGTVRSRIHRGRRDLRRALVQWDQSRSVIPS